MWSSSMFILYFSAYYSYFLVVIRLAMLIVSVLLIWSTNTRHPKCMIPFMVSIVSNALFCCFQAFQIFPISPGWTLYYLALTSVQVYFFQCIYSLNSKLSNLSHKKTTQIQQTPQVPHPDVEKQTGVKPQGDFLFPYFQNQPEKVIATTLISSV